MIGRRVESGENFLDRRIFNLETIETTKLFLTIEQKNSQETRRDNSSFFFVFFFKMS